MKVPLDDTPFEEHLRLILEDVGLVVATMGLVYVCCTKPGQDRLALTHELWWYPFVFVLLFYAFAASHTLGATIASRWTGSCVESSRFFRLYVAAQLLAVPVELATSGRKALPMLAHHAVSIASYLYGLYSKRCAFFGTAAGLSEVSTIFLEGVLISKRPDLAFLFRKVPWFLPLNGALLWLTYILFRLVLFPALLAIYVRDSLRNTPFTSFAVAKYTVFIIPISLVFLFVLSASWFSRIHKGFVEKVLGALRKSSDSHCDSPTVPDTTRGAAAAAAAVKVD